MKMRKSIIIALTLTSLTGGYDLSAQNISTEVTVKYDETPTLMSVDKLAITPSISLPSLPKASLPLQATGQIQIPNSITSLQPAAYADTIYTSPYRGYAAIGFMPRFNLGASAGYKLFDTDKTRLNTWLQYDGTYYRDKSYGGVRRNTATLGADLHQAVGTKSFIDAGIDYTLSRYNTSTSFDEPLDRANQTAHRLNLSGLWSLRHNAISYRLGLDYGYFAYAKALTPALPVADIQLPDILTPVAKIAPAREHHVEFNTLFSGGFAGANEAGLDLRVNHLAYNDYIPALASIAPSNAHTLLSLTPFYRFDISSIHLLVGAKIDVTFNCGKAFHIAPVASVTCLPTQYVKLYVKATGGERQNTLASLYDVTPYATPRMNYANSHIPVDATVGVTVGQWRGFYADINFSYAIANEWLMPEYLTADNGDALLAFQALNYRGFRAQIEAGYDYRGIVEVKAQAALAPHSYKRGYYLWRDRANVVTDLSLRVTPIKPLDVTVGWELRTGRRQYAMGEAMSLGSLNNFSAGALYRINPQWSAFVRGENLFNHHHLLIGGVPAQGLTGLVGATYKF